MGTQNELILRVASQTAVPDLASAIAHGVYDSRDVVMRAIGNGAIGQAMKALAAARGLAGPRAINLGCIPGFIDIDINGETLTGMVLRVVVL